MEEAKFYTLPFKKQSPYSFAHARLISAFSRNSKKWYVFRSCFNLSTPYPDFPRKQTSKEAMPLPRLRSLASSFLRSQTTDPHRTSHGAVSKSGQCMDVGKVFI